MMNGKVPQVTELEAELTRLSAMVRERRKQLARLEKCPNKDCPCRFVWREHIEENLAGQIGTIQRQVCGQTRKAVKPRARARRRSGK
jgi:hypothetical protein